MPRSMMLNAFQDSNSNAITETNIPLHSSKSHLTTNTTTTTNSWTRNADFRLFQNSSALPIGCPTASGIGNNCEISHFMKL